MLKIGSGRAKDLGIKFWEIIDGAGTRLTEFNHSRFPTILSDAPVYFMDLDLDPKQCENVQAKAQVDQLVGLATPTGGIADDAETTLRLFIMSALLRALDKQGASRTTYLEKLEARLRGVAAAAPPPLHRVNLQLLKDLGIAE
jgi:hypothetical protein